MNKVWLGIAYALMGLCLSAPNSWAQEKKGPRLLVKEKVFDAGEIDEGKPIEHAFIVSNEGDEVLKIEKVKPG